MNRLIPISFAIILAISAVSCTDKDAKELKEKLSKPIDVPTVNQKLSKASIKQYRDAELAYNERYVEELKKTLDNSFERQLDNFDDNELGFFSSYGNMFDYIFMSKEKFEDSWKVKSIKYFVSVSALTSGIKKAGRAPVYSFVHMSGRRLRYASMPEPGGSTAALFKVSER